VPYRGIVINLDQSIERRADMHAQLATLGLKDRYVRSSAIDGRVLRPAGTISAREQACFRSHCDALRLAMDFGCTAHIVEDDTIFAPQFDVVVRGCIKAGWLNPYDIVFTNAYVATYAFRVRELKNLFDWCTSKSGFVVLDFGDLYQCISASYLVPPDKIASVLSRFESGAAKHDAPIDLFIRRETGAGRLKLGCIFPFITTQFRPGGEAATTISDRDVGLATSRATVTLLGYSFFVGRDLAALRAALPNHYPGDEHGNFIADVMRFVVASPDFKIF